MATTTTTFKSYAEFSATVTAVTKALRVFSRTNRCKAEGALAVASKLGADDLRDSYSAEFPAYFGTKLGAALYAVAWGQQTGRLHVGAERMLAELSGYQYAKLVVKIALTGATMQEVVDYLNGRVGLPLPL